MSIGELPFEVILEKITVLTNEIRSVEEQLTTINNQIGSFSTSITNLTNQVNTLTTEVNSLKTRMNDAENAINALGAGIMSIENRLANDYVRRVEPLPGYNPYNLTGTVTAKVWMYELPFIKDNNIKFYYVQFNEINGPSGGISNWIPLPHGTFNNFIYALHPEYHIGGLIVGAPTIPAAFSGDGISYRLLLSNTEDAFRLVINAGSPNGQDYIGFWIIGNK
jgi:regulator of replication initiation timing